jgi:hypothetical protein
MAIVALPRHRKYSGRVGWKFKYNKKKNDENLYINFSQQEFFYEFKKCNEQKNSTNAEN